MAISLDSPKSLSKLDAVNIILRSRGLGTAASLGASSRPAVKEAEEVLASTNLEVQGSDYNFNKELRLKLTPNASDEIVVPGGLLSFEPTYTSAHLSITQRGGRLYDLSNSTFKFDSPVYVQATTAIPFEDLPQPVRWYITLLAAFQHANQTVPGDASMRPTEMQVGRAKSDFEAFDSKLVSNNLRTNPHFKRMRGRR